MCSFEVVDTHDESALREWWSIGSAATAERPGQPWPPWEHSRIALPAPDTEVATTLVTLRDGSRTAAGLVVLWLHDNLHAAQIEVYVAPEDRRHGLGTRLEQHLVALAGEQGRTTMLGEAFVPPGGTAPSEDFAQARGYDLAHREAIKELTFSDYLDRREALLDDVQPHEAAYEIVTFDTICPEPYAESYAALLSTLMDEIPLGELDLASETYTVERMRAAEQRVVGIGRHVLTALAIAPEGGVAGCSDVRINESDTEHGEVGVTLVDPAHRGHRLGLRLKLATHDLAHQLHPELVSVETSNAEVNQQMNAINEALGYRSIETLLELQKKLDS